MAIEVSNSLKTTAVDPSGSVPLARIELYPIFGVVAPARGLRRYISDGHVGVPGGRILWTDLCPLAAFNWGDAPPLGINPNMLTDGRTWTIHLHGYFLPPIPDGYTGSIKYTFGYVSTNYARALPRAGWTVVEGAKGPSPHAITECAYIEGHITSPVQVGFVYANMAGNEQYRRHKAERLVILWKDDIDNEWRILGADVTCPRIPSFSNVVGSPVADVLEPDIFPQTYGSYGGDYRDPADYPGTARRYLLTIHEDGGSYHFHRDNSDTEFTLVPGTTIEHALHPGVAGGDFVTITWSDTVSHGDMAEVDTAEGELDPWVLPYVRNIEIDASDDAASVLKFAVPVTEDAFDPDNVTDNNIYTYYTLHDSFGVLRRNALVKAYLGYKVGGQPEVIRRFTGFIQDIKPIHRGAEATEKAVEVTCLDARVKAVNAPVTKIEDLVMSGLPNQLSYDIIGCFPETYNEQGPDGSIRPVAFDRWKLANVVRTVLYQCGFMSSQLWAKDVDGNFLIDDRNVYLECTIAYPFSYVSELGARAEAAETVESSPEFMWVPTAPSPFGGPQAQVMNDTTAIRQRRWTEFSSVRDAGYLHQFALDADPWQSLQNLCQSYGIKIGVNADGNVYLRYPNNPKIYNTHEDDADGGTGAAYTVDTVTDTAKAWAHNQWAGGWVTITLGKGMGQTRRVHYNDATVLTVSYWNEIPDQGSWYVVYNDPTMLDNNITYDAGWVKTPAGHQTVAGSGTDE